LIKQPYWQKEAAAGFLRVTVELGNDGNELAIYFGFYYEFGKSLYSYKKHARVCP
jgi:hypothetical protein